MYVKAGSHGPTSWTKTGLMQPKTVPNRSPVPKNSTRSTQQLSSVVGLLVNFRFRFRSLPCSVWLWHRMSLSRWLVAVIAQLWAALSPEADVRDWASIPFQKRNRFGTVNGDYRCVQLLQSINRTVLTKDSFNTETAVICSRHFLPTFFDHGKYWNWKMSTLAYSNTDLWTITLLFFGKATHIAWLFSQSLSQWLLPVGLGDMVSSSYQRLREQVSEHVTVRWRFWCALKMKSFIYLHVS